MLRFGGRQIPVFLPSIRDPRLHLASVIISIHILGQVALGFRVSVPQILAAILTCAVIEVSWTLAKSGTLSWPASAMLTGSGVALIFRVVGTESGDHWSWHAWWLFAIVAGLSLLTKYTIRYRGSHVFNPSNVGLVAAFLVLGSTRVEPLDFWWAPLNGWMAAAYLIILVGGLLITRRLRLLAMSAAFWITLAVGIGLLAASGHCMTARWSFEPVCGSHFWWVILLSPEVLIFLFFMITDPKTVPAGRVGRIVFAVCVALASTLLIAPQTTEFGAKVALLSGLVILCAARPIMDRVLPAAGSDRDRVGISLTRLLRHGDIYAPPRRAFARGALAGAAGVFLVTALVVAGVPARESVRETRAQGSPALSVEVDPSTLPTVTVAAEVGDMSQTLTGSGARRLAVTLAENLEVEAQALRGGEKSVLSAVDDGSRLSEMQRRVDDVVATGRALVPHYTFESLHLVLIRSEGQAGLSVGVQARGTVEEVSYGVDGTEEGRVTTPFAITFVMSRPTGDRWLIVDSLPLD